MKLIDTLRTAAAWRRACRIDALRDEAPMRRLQSRWLARHLEYVATRSPFYRPFRGQPLQQWPVLSKQPWLANFDAINTVGASLVACEQLALRSEASRDFSANWRGLFLVSPAERAWWAGTMLGRLLRQSPLMPARIALVLRAGSTLYESVQAARLSFRYFDPLRPWDALCEDLVRFDPTILVAPAQVLVRLAALRTPPRPQRVISAAEVLDDIDRAKLEQAFRTQIEQVYQATEGLLGVSCPHGAIHLNEPWLVIEPEWQDATRTRFVPVITDLWRRAQPVIRYRLDDVLRVLPDRCACGRPGMAVAAIEGRCDDVLVLQGHGREVPVFADQLARQIVCTLAPLEDYEVSETARGRWIIRLAPLPDESGLVRLRHAIEALTRQLGADVPSLAFAALEASTSGGGKRRRIRGAGAHACAS